LKGVGTPALRVRVQQEDFDVGELQRELLQGSHEEGSVASFTGYVRASNGGRRLAAMELEHYPGMTERSIEDIIDQAAVRWSLIAATVVHRTGALQPGDRIVWVGAASAHREASFSACEFIMDYLKTRAPFWKREVSDDGASWVEARASDDARAARWESTAQD
jgi:molybdopterin synthase catalytic subunit